MHVRTHTREHLHYCSQCSYSSITKNCLKRHVIQRHSNVLLKCPSEGCQYSTPDKYKLQAHLKTHSEIVSTKDVCLGKEKQCKLQFANLFLNNSRLRRSLFVPSVRRHFQKTNSGIILKLTIQVKEMKIPGNFLCPSLYLNYKKCFFCLDTSLTTTLEALGIRAHVKGAIGKRASKCPYCDCYFTRNGTDMQQHIWAHEGEVQWFLVIQKTSCNKNLNFGCQLRK